MSQVETDGGGSSSTGQDSQRVGGHQGLGWISELDIGVCRCNVMTMMTMMMTVMTVMTAMTVMSAMTIQQ